MFCRPFNASNFYSRVFLLVSLLITPCLRTYGQESKSQSNKRSARDSTREEPCGKRGPSLLKIRLFIEQTKRFKDLDAATRGVVELSSLLWQCDPQYAEAALLELHGKLKTEIAKQQDGSRTVSQASTNSDQISVTKLKYLESYVLASLNLHNPALARHLADGNSLPWDEVNYATVKSLLDQGDYENATAELRKSITQGSDYGNISLLINLRQRDPATADALYLTYLGRLAYQPSLTTETVATAGVYLFLGTPSFDVPAGLLEVAFVDRTPVPQFISKNPAASETALRAYLNLVAGLLARPVQSISEKKARYALGRVLFPYIPQTEIGLINSFLSDIQRLSNEVTEGIKNDRIYESITNAAHQDWDNLDKQLEGIQKLPFTNQRDELCVMLAYSLYSLRSYEKAMKVVEIMSLSEVKDRLSTVIRLAVALQQLEQKKFEEARRATESASAGPQRSAVLLEIANALSQTRDGEGSTQMIMQAIDDARHSNGIERPLLLIKAAGAIKKSDPGFARQLLLEALDKISAIEKGHSPVFETEANARGSVVKFRLPGLVGLNFSAVIEPFVKENPDEMATALSGLKSEQLRVDGLLTVAKYLMSATEKSAFPKSN